MFHEGSNVTLHVTTFDELTTLCSCLQHFLIDGSPQWEVYRNVSMPAVSEPGQMSLPAAEPAVTLTQAGLIMPEYKQQPQVQIELTTSGARIPSADI